MHEATSKHMDGISDLVVVAPLKPGFIHAFENVSHVTRLKLVAEALNRVRVSAREHERVLPYSDVTERILNLLDFRVGVLDHDLFGLRERDARSTEAPSDLTPRRYLFLAATFEGGWEPYMRLIWNPLGPFLDLLFCNCDGYVTATGHDCAEYLQWVRDNQVDSASFYTATGLTTRDQRYLSRLERLQRETPDDLARAALTMPYPDDESAATRQAHLRKSIELALEALTVLYKLADYYPPGWMIQEPAADAAPPRTDEGLLLIRAASELLKGWEEIEAFAQSAQATAELKALWGLLQKVYAEPLNWFRSGRQAVARENADRVKSRPDDPPLDSSDVQAGILQGLRFGEKKQYARTGAMLLLTVRDTQGARAFIQRLLDRGDVCFEADAASGTAQAVACTLAFTAMGLRRLGMDRDVLDMLPKEFRDGPAARSGLFGDQRENHPRNWQLPERNGPAFLAPAAASGRLPPVDMDEVDIVLVLRSASVERGDVETKVSELAAMAHPAATLEAIDWLHSQYDDEARFRDHFGFLDGISQPRPQPYPQGSDKKADRDHVNLGEVLVGYSNDRSDGPPRSFAQLDGEYEGRKSPTAWRRAFHDQALDFQRNGSFLVVRKIGEDVERFNTWLDESADQVARQLGHLGMGKPEARALLRAKVLGRDDKGQPLVPTAAGATNDFDYENDANGFGCPHAAHIRRANPRRTSTDANASSTSRAEFGRPTPRLVRRGMLFGNEKEASRGLMFMAYNASIAEQYEVIQRWLNGGNSTDVAAAQNDALTGVLPKEGPATFRFVVPHGRPGQGTVVRVPLRDATTDTDSKDPGAEPGRHPFTPLHWMLYLIVPGRAALQGIAAWKGQDQAMRDPLEMAVGQHRLDLLAALTPEQAAQEWKQLLEDFGAKDPTERDLSPHLWAAIRWAEKGVVNLKHQNADGSTRSGTLPVSFEDATATRAMDGDVAHNWDKPDPLQQNVILCAGRRQILDVLSRWDDFTVQEQLRRIIDTSGPIYVTQQPDGQYHGELAERAKELKLDYHTEALATNGALLTVTAEKAYAVGYTAGTAVLARSIDVAKLLQKKYFKLELRRQYLQPAIGLLWTQWYGPLHEQFDIEGWSWKHLDPKAAGDDPVNRRKPRCPGDFLSPSRHSFYPRPGELMAFFASQQGQAILAAGLEFVKANRPKVGKLPALGQRLFQAIEDDNVLARNLIGTMIGANPPMDANLRNILFEWLSERSLWRHQAAMHQALAGQPAADHYKQVNEALSGPISRAMCMRPAPDLLYRTAQRHAAIARGRPEESLAAVQAEPGDLVVLSLASAAQRSLMKTPDGDVSIIFGGNRQAATQGYTGTPPNVKPVPTEADPAKATPVHACPAQQMAMGAMTGILAALLDVGQIQAQPASLIVRISGWKQEPAPAPQTPASPSP